MKKSILIGVLSALMLFAFVACDNNSAAGLNSMVTGLSVTSAAPEYFVGETPSIDDYTIVATRLDGSTFTVSADEIDVDFTATTTASEETPVAVATAAYNGITYGDIKPVTLTAYVYTLDQISVAGPEGLSASYYGLPTDETFNKAAYTVTAEAVDEADDDAVLFSRTLSADEYAVSAAMVTSNATSGDANITFTADYGTSVTDVVKVMIYEDYLTDISVAAKDDVEVIIGDTPKSSSPADFFDITGTYVSGKTAPITADGTNVKISWAENALKDGKFTSAAATAQVTTTINGAAVTRSASITPVKDYLESFTASYNRSVYVNGSVDAAGVVIGTQTWASGGSTPVTEGVEAIDTSDVLVNGQASVQVPAGLSATETFPVSVTINGQAQAPAYTIVVTLTANSSQGGTGSQG